MSNSNLKSLIVATAMSLALLAPAANAQDTSRAAQYTLSRAIASQGNAALRVIQAEMKVAARALKPALPARAARSTRISAPATGALPATAACAR
jgi:hypothetical protein